MWIIPQFAFQKSEMISSNRGCPQSSWCLDCHVASLWLCGFKELLHGLRHALWPPSVLRVLHSVVRQTYETHHHFLITSSSALWDSPFCFSLGFKSGPRSQDLLHNLCLPKYVFPLAVCLHLEFLPGRQNNKNHFNFFVAYFLSACFSDGITTNGSHLPRVSCQTIW